ncbi:ATP-binding protein [Candidatus Bathyarchaeota archaeon]|nr:ATP-binding protein [Candidatus Bathyarchaeota archaeon]
MIYLPEPDDARLATSQFIMSLLALKKSMGANRSRRVLLILDEAQEFIPDRVRSEDFTDMSNRAVEALLRHGRKYRAHCWLSTQRVAHLNVSALHQLHSYFVSVLPRSYDRWVIAEAFSLNTALLDRTIELETGEWPFVSYKATRQKNIPTFIKAPNNEDILASRLLGQK